MIRRREFITLLGGAAAAWPLAARAQQPAMPVVGFLGSDSAAWSHLVSALMQRLRELGYIENRTFAIEYRWTEGRDERYAAMAAELVGMKVDIIVALGTPAIVAARKATAVIPIVFPIASDPVGDGLVASLSRPGGNVTGLSTQQPDLTGKRLEILREIVPGLSRLTVLANGDNPLAILNLREVQAAASKLGLEVNTLDVKRANDIAPAIDQLMGRTQALYVVGDSLVFNNQVQINTLALVARLPTMHNGRGYVETGGLISYGPSFPDLFRRAAEMVDKILRGAKPADIPVEQPTKYRASNQPQDREGARPRHTADPARPRRRGDRMRRREFITLLGGAAAWPLAARAQQAALPVIGFLIAQSPDTNANRLRAFRQGLKDAGYVEGENVTIEYRWAEGRYEQLPAQAADLVRRRVDVIAAFAPHAALAAKAATSTIPIVFSVPEDPVRLGLVASLARPGGNLTGINFFVGELVAKRLDLLRELLPAAARVAVLINPTSPAAEITMRDAEVAARALGLQIQVLRASTSREINAAFATFVNERPDAVFVGGDPFFNDRRIQLANVASYHRVPATYSNRDLAEAGGLMSYGTNIADSFRTVGIYTGRVLKGAKPADLPVVQASKFELVINAQTARMLGLAVPPTLLAPADEVIE